MICLFDDEVEALAFLWDFGKHGIDADVIVCSAVYMMAKDLARRFYESLPESSKEFRRDVARVDVRSGPNKFRFISVGNGGRVCGLRPKMLVLVTHLMPKDVLENMLLGFSEVSK